jgi:hypothetical protein
MVAEVADAISQSARGFRFATGKVFRAEDHILPHC